MLWQKLTCMCHSQTRYLQSVDLTFTQLSVFSSGIQHCWKLSTKAVAKWKGPKNATYNLLTTMQAKFFHEPYKISLPQKRNTFSSRFWYSERTNNSTEANLTSKECPEPQRFFCVRSTWAWLYQEGVTHTWRKEYISFFAVMKMKDAQ